jgi:predicted molibdopterin-dependent oxidoreductase YjgC
MNRIDHLHQEWNAHRKAALHGGAMFRRLREAQGGRIGVTIDGTPVDACAGDSVAAAMLAAGLDHCRATAVPSGQRAPHCTMATCFDCLVTVDGIGNRQGCLVEVRNGMRIETQHGRRTIE